MYESENDKQITGSVFAPRLLISSHTSERFCWWMCSTQVDDKLIFKLCIFPENWSYILYYWNYFFCKNDYKISVSQSASSGRHSHLKYACLISDRSSIHALCLFWGDYYDSIPQDEFLVLFKIAAKWKHLSFLSIFTLFIFSSQSKEQGAEGWSLSI